MVLRIITALLLAIWLVLVLIGKGGFVHLLILTAIAMTVIEGVTTYRAKMVDENIL
jgi:hypothetical protein